MQLQIGVKVLIQNSAGEYLFIQRSEPLSSDIHKSWDIPGGRINPDENLADALIREVEEEVHVTLHNAPKLIAAQDIFVDSKNLHVVRLTYLTNENISTVILSDEHENYEWRSLDNIDDLNIESYLKEVLDTLAKKV